MALTAAMTKLFYFPFVSVTNLNISSYFMLPENDWFRDSFSPIYCFIFVESFHIDVG